MPSLKSLKTASTSKKSPKSPEKEKPTKPVVVDDMDEEDSEDLDDEDFEEGDDDDEEEENESKKESKSRELTILSKETGLKKTSLRKLNTMFGKQSATIIQLLEVGNSDGALALTTKSMLQTLIDLLPVLERNVRRTKGQRGVYQLNQMISQIREMCSDIQAYKDKANLGQSLVERFIRPSFLDLAVQITQMLSHIDESAKSRMSSEDYKTFRSEVIEHMRRNIASYMRTQFEDISSSLVKAMG